MTLTVNMTATGIVFLNFVNQTLPILSGTPVVGQSLHLSDGTWTQLPLHISYRYWSSPDGVTGWVTIQGAYENDYIIQPEVLGRWIKGSIAASFNGTQLVDSNILGPVTALVSLPTLPATPQLTLAAESRYYN
jgi:hypothetical protein